MTRALDPARSEVASLTDTGLQRANNQDAFGEGHSPSGARLLVVADGMGGHAAGEIASRIAVETVVDFISGSQDPPRVALRTALELANAAIHEQSQADPNLSGMGTTGVAALVGCDGTAVVANVGDSRAYHLRGDVFEQVSHDHSLVGELQRRGVLSEEEARVHPRRNEVMRSLGIEPEVEVELHDVALAEGDQLLLCSDGLSGPVRDPEIAEVLRAEAPGNAARRLVELANERGGPDNVTVVVARIAGAALATPSASGLAPGLGPLGPLGTAIALAAFALTVAGLWRCSTG